ncbi:MAG: phosphonate ABC transporter substrate-binding protein [Planctomycetes bacterium]|nr:phosphonate ABC transporter substrate-binding protein [Planctomycetota bacterium]
MIRPLALAAVAVLGLGSLQAAEPFVFGIIATESSAALKKDFEPLRAGLEKTLGTSVETFVAPDYTGVIEAMRFNKVQLGWFGNKSGIDAVDRAGGEVFCQVVDKDGNPGYWSLIIVHMDSPINTLEELFAKKAEISFSYGDPQSTSGTLVPGYYAFAKNKVTPGVGFKGWRNGNHEANALAVANKQVDAATYNTESYFRLEAKHPEKAKQLKQIWKSPLIASDPMIYKADLPADTKKKVAEFFIGYGKTEAEKAAIAPLKWSGFRASDNNQLLPYRLMGLLKDKAKVEADEKYTSDEKKAKVAEFDKKIAEIESKLKQ